MLKISSCVPHRFGWMQMKEEISDNSGVVIYLVMVENTRKYKNKNMAVFKFLNNNNFLHNLMLGSPYQGKNSWYYRLTNEGIKLILF